MGTTGLKRTQTWNHLLVGVLVVIFAAHGVEITVGGNSVATASKTHYGINLWGGIDPVVAENPRYQSNLKAMGITTARFHNMGMAKWIDVTNRCWNTNAIRRTMAALGPLFSVKMVTCCKAPTWMDEDGDKRIDETHLDDYAAWCAGLVNIVNVQGGAGVQWWETLNEGELGGYKKKEDGEVMADIFRRCRKAMLAVDPTIKVGGNAFSWSLPAQASGLLATAGSELAFYSYHSYGTGDPKIEAQALYDKALSADPSKVRNSLKGLGLALPIWLDEWNMFFDWKADSQRHFMISHRGPVFDAIYLKKAIESSGMDYLLAWNDADNTYGKMSTKFDLFPGASIFILYNRYFVGEVLETSTDGDVIPFAVRGADGQMSVSLANRSGDSQVVNLALPKSFPRVTRHFISTNGIEAKPEDPKGRSWTLPAESVTVLTFE